MAVLEEVRASAPNSRSVRANFRHADVEHRGLDMHVCRRVCRRVCIKGLQETKPLVRIDMCIDMCLGMHVDIYRDMHTDIYRCVMTISSQISIHTSIRMYANASAYVALTDCRARRPAPLHIRSGAGQGTTCPYDGPSRPL